MLSDVNKHILNVCFPLKDWIINLLCCPHCKKMAHWFSRSFMVLCAADVDPSPLLCCVQVAVASEDPSALRRHWNQPHPCGPARTAAEPGAAQSSSPHHHHGQPAEYDSTTRPVYLSQSFCLSVFLSVVPSDSLLCRLGLDWLEWGGWCCSSTNLVSFLRDRNTTWELLQA